MSKWRRYEPQCVPPSPLSIGNCCPLSALSKNCHAIVVNKPSPCASGPTVNFGHDSEKTNFLLLLHYYTDYTHITRKRREKLKGATQGICPTSLLAAHRRAWGRVASFNRRYEGDFWVGGGCWNYHKHTTAHWVPRRCYSSDHVS